MSSSNQQADQGRSAAQDMAKSVPPAFKPIGISSVKAAVEQMREKAVTKPAGELPPALMNEIWAA